MFLELGRKKVIFLTIFSLGFYSCGMKKSNDTNTETQTVPTNPNISLAAIAPDGVLYIDKSDSSLNMNSENVKGFMPSLNLFQAEANGGLGADLNGTDKLESYPGIPLAPTLTDISENALTVNVTTTGDSACENTFSYNAKNKLIEIDSSKINTLTICNLDIVASAPFKDKSYTAKSSFEVALNPTMKTYFNSGDVGVKYLNAYIVASSPDLLANKLKKIPDGSLTLKFDSKRSSFNITNLNVLTGLQSVKSLDVSGTNLSDLRAIRFLKNLESLDISDTKIIPSDLKMLGSLSHLKSLSVRNLSIKDLTLISKYLPKLESLDISGNKIENISTLSAFKELKTLKVENIGIEKTNSKNLMQTLKTLTKLNQLDVGQNDLSSLNTSEDSATLAQLDLESLNVSQSHITDAFLDNYFGLVSRKIIGLKEFIDRNVTNMAKISTCENINNFKKITNFKDVTSLIRLDLHGNGCNVDGDAFHDIGLTNTLDLAGMISLQYLDISNTAVSTLDGLKFMRFLKTAIVADAEGGIDMSRQSCLDSAQRFAQGVQINCSDLRSGETISKVFDVPGTYQWPVPPNVWHVTLSGCSGANGASGAGGGGGGAAFNNVQGNGGQTQTANDSFGGMGGDSGLANGSSQSSGSNGSTGQCAQLHDELSWVREVRSFGCGGGAQAPKGGNGGDAGLGEQTSFGNKSFSFASANVQRDIHSCFGGVSSSGGGGGGGVHVSIDSHNYAGGNGGAGAHGIDGWNAPKEENISYDVTPGDTINIVVGKGGHGGGAGAAGSNQCGGGGSWFNGCSSGGASGNAGTDGQDGSLTIEYQE